MEIISAIRDWFRHRAKLTSFRLLVLLAMASLTVSMIPALRNLGLPNQVLALIGLGLIYLLLEIVLDTTGDIKEVQRAIVAAQTEGVLYKWNDALPIMRQEIEHASSVLILANSGEMAYHAFRDILLEKGNHIKTEIYMVAAVGGRDDEEVYQKIWKSNWETLGECISGVHRFISSTAFRLGAVIIDNQIGYLGYIGDASARKHSAPSIRVTAKTQVGLWLLDEYRQWIAHHMKALAKESA